MNGMDNFQVVNHKIVFEHAWIRVIVDELGRDGKARPYLFVDSAVDSVATVAITDDRQIVLTRQYRHPIRRIITDLPGGVAHPDEEPLEGAKRELHEETGYVPGKMIPLGKMNPFPGSLRATIYLFFASELTFAGQKLDEDEELEVHLRSFDEVYREILAGEHIDATLQAGALMARAQGLA
jgi:ADP-ribose pyrophosphatase